MAVISRLRPILARINAERIDRGLEPYSQQRLANEAGIGIRAVTRLHTEGRKGTRVDFKTLNGLCRVLHVQVGDLLVYRPDVGE